jgi:chromosome segregation ATPase
MRECRIGDYVRYDDHARVVEQLDALKAENDKLKAAVAIDKSYSALTYAAEQAEEADRLKAEVARLRHDPKADSRAVIEEWRAKAESAWADLTLANEVIAEKQAIIERLDEENHRLKAESEYRREEYVSVIRSAQVMRDENTQLRGLLREYYDEMGLPDYLEALDLKIQAELKEKP